MLELTYVLTIFLRTHFDTILCKTRTDILRTQSSYVKLALIFEGHNAQ